MKAMATSTNNATAPASLIHQPPSFFERLDQARIFVRPQPLEVELGCGDSTLLVELARRCPEHNFIGVERLLGRIRKLDRKGRRAGLTNLRGVRIECSYFMQYLLPAHSVSALHIYFPDPWPKRRHQHHRLINDQFPALAYQVLEPGGTVYLRTDDADYFRQMNTVFGASPLFRPAKTPAELATLTTDFEQDFQAKGIQSQRSAYQVVRS